MLVVASSTLITSVTASPSPSSVITRSTSIVSVGRVCISRGFLVRVEWPVTDLGEWAEALVVALGVAVVAVPVGVIQNSNSRESVVEGCVTKDVTEFFPDGRVRGGWGADDVDDWLGDSALCFFPYDFDLES